MVVPVTFAETSVRLSFGGKTTTFSVLVDGVDDPVDSSISSDGLVGGAVEHKKAKVKHLVNPGYVFQ